MKMKIGRLAAVLAALLMLTAAALAETEVTLSPESARVGEAVEIRVSADAGASSVVYSVRCGEKTVFDSEKDVHFSAAFRPRQEGDYTVSVRVLYPGDREETARAEITVAGTAETPMGPDTVYSQKDGSWKDKKYGKSELEKAGCAIFTLSHALQRMGWTADDVRPEALAVTYAGCYTQGGTANARLLYRAAEVYGYTTSKELLQSEKAIRAGLLSGDYYSFSIVTGHIALACGIDSAGKKVKIVDSAPGATFERIKKGKIYYAADGGYREAKDPGEIPGILYYPETGTWGGAEYYMDLSYVARRGARLIRPGWMFMRTDAGRTGVTPEETGTVFCVVTAGGKNVEVPTRELSWTRDGSAGKLAFVNRKTAAKLLDGAGKKIGAAEPCAVVPVLEAEDDRYLVMVNGKRGYLKAADAELLEPAAETKTGKISVNGSTSGRATVKMRFGPSGKDKVMANWKTGTRVAIVDRKDGFYQVEAKGLRLWVQEDYVTPDDPAESEKEEPDA